MGKAREAALPVSIGTLWDNWYSGTQVFWLQCLHYHKKICEITETFSWAHRAGKCFLEPGVQVPGIADCGIVASFTSVCPFPSADLIHKLILALGFVWFSPQRVNAF